MSVPSCYVCNKILIKQFFWRFHYNKESLPDVRFSQWCCKWLKSSGLWHCHRACSSWLFDGSWSHPVYCQAFMDVTAIWSHEASVITCPTTQMSYRRRLEFSRNFYNSLQWQYLQFYFWGCLWLVVHEHTINPHSLCHHFFRRMCMFQVQAP
jgi:hypothetical protein